MGPEPLSGSLQVWSHNVKRSVDNMRALAVRFLPESLFQTYFLWSAPLFCFFVNLLRVLLSWMGWQKLAVLSLRVPSFEQSTTSIFIWNSAINNFYVECIAEFFNTWSIWNLNLARLWKSRTLAQSPWWKQNPDQAVEQKAVQRFSKVVCNKALLHPFRSWCYQNQSFQFCVVH